MAKTPTQLPAQKPRNFVAKNATTGGAGAHKDKKKALKQGDTKHKNKSFDMAESATPGYIKYEEMVNRISEVIAKLWHQGEDSETIGQLKDRVAKHLGYDPKDSIYDQAWFRSLSHASANGELDNDEPEDDYTDYSMRQGEMGNPDSMREEVSKLHKAWDKALKTKPVSPAQQQRNKERWSQRQAEKGVSEGSNWNGPLRKKKIKESYTDWLHNVLDEVVAARKK